MNTVLQHKIDYIIQELSACHRIISVDSANLYRYFLSGQYLFPLKQIGFVPFLGMVKHLQKPQIFKLPFLCDYIRIKNNLRIIGYGPRRNSSVKIGLKSFYKKGLLYREIKARKILENVNPKFIPAIKQYGHNGSNWILEENITKCDKLDNDYIVGHFMENIAFSMYKATLRLKPFPPKMLNDIFCEYPELRKKINCSLDYDALHIPFALCHGDLSPGNMMVDKNRNFFVIDWEQASVQPVASDLIRLIIKYPWTINKVIALIEEFTAVTINGANKKTVNAVNQLLLITAHKKIELQQQRRLKLNYYASALKLNHKESIHKYESSLQQYRLLIKKLSCADATPEL